jgi:hypothetical protein
LRKALIAGEQVRSGILEQPQSHGLLIEVLPADFVADLDNEVTRRDIRSDIEIAYGACEAGTWLESTTAVEAKNKEDEEKQQRAKHVRSYKMPLVIDY